MQTSKLPTDFLTKKSFESLNALGFMAYGVSLVTGYVAEFNPVWLALLVSVILALIRVFILKKKSAIDYVLVFGNGILIYLTATGINTISNSSTTFNSNVKTNIQDSTKKSGMLTDGVYLSSILPFDKPWFLPQVLVDENNKLLEDKGKLLSEKDSVISANKKLTDLINQLPKDEKEFRNKLDSMNNVIKNIMEENHEAQERF